MSEPTRYIGCMIPNPNGSGSHVEALEPMIGARFYDALAAEMAAWKTIVDDLNAGCVINEDRIRALEADRDQISLTLAVAKADRNKWFNRARDLEKALRDFKDHGLRFDLNPTHDLTYTRGAGGASAATFWHAYIKDMDETVRQRARNALTALETACDVDPTPEHQLKQGIRSGSVRDRGAKRG